MPVLSRTLGKQLAVGTAAAVTTFVLLAQASSAFASLRGAGQSPALSPEAQEVVDRTNAVRREHGCKPLTADPALTGAAQAHSEDMAAHDYFSHAGRNGSHAGDRITAAGYRWSAWAENIAAGYSAEDVVAAWMASDGHRANILNCRLRDLGVGYVDDDGAYGTYWTQNFGTPR